MKIATFLLKNGDHPKLVVDFLQQDTIRKKIIESVQDFVEKKLQRRQTMEIVENFLSHFSCFSIVFSVFIIFLHFSTFFLVLHISSFVFIFFIFSFFFLSLHFSLFFIMFLFVVLSLCSAHCSQQPHKFPICAVLTYNDSRISLHKICQMLRNCKCK